MGIKVDKYVVTCFDIYGTEVADVVMVDSGEDIDCTRINHLSSIRYLRQTEYEVGVSEDTYNILKRQLEIINESCSDARTDDKELDFVSFSVNMLAKSVEGTRLLVVLTPVKIGNKEYYHYDLLYKGHYLVKL